MQHSLELKMFRLLFKRHGEAAKFPFIGLQLGLSGEVLPTMVVVHTRKREGGDEGERMDHRLVHVENFEKLADLKSTFDFWSLKINF